MEDQAPAPTQSEIDAPIARGRPVDLVAIVHAILSAPCFPSTDNEEALICIHRAAIAAIEAARPDLRAAGGA